MNRRKMARSMSYLGLAAALALGLGTAAAAQDSQQIVVPLSDPGSPAVLSADLMNGSIIVNAYDGTDIVVDTTMGGSDGEVEERNGLKRIPNTSVGLTVEERSNRITIEADWSSRATQLVVKVPRQTSLHLATVNNGDIEITGVDGTHELANVNGAIRAIDVSGSVVASTTNGEVRVRFVSMEAGKPMSFSTFNGDVDLTVPSNTAANLVLQSGQGDIYTDFDVDLAPQAVKMNKDEGSKGFRVRLEKEVVGTINGGGAEFRFKTYNGDIYVRKSDG